ncbi:hypothetical protein GCM10020367_64250 [Streptomyces sannanensis]|uniref:Uncharacterized protein n=1 Tax=Streptomyces sannanensis TaxID=285536 RepID=A0ABP6SLH0_9ACTN
MLATGTPDRRLSSEILMRSPRFRAVTSIAASRFDKPDWIVSVSSYWIVKVSSYWARRAGGLDRLLLHVSRAPWRDIASGADLPVSCRTGAICHERASMAALSEGRRHV